MKPQKTIITDHDIDPRQIDSDAIAVLRKLHEKGFAAYLVGGSVRDLLTKREPKDCDISTLAKPEEIKALFGRSCLLIGRRFRLAHIRFGRKIIEVSTFRSGDNDGDLIVRDNTWGTEEQDVLRRDFTINGLFYDPTNHTVIDYVGGLEDIRRGIIRTIGDPGIRFKQDPVRMIRLLKFKARFDFAIERKTEQALRCCLDEIFKSSPARVMEEILRMLESGASAPFFELLFNSELLVRIFPYLAQVFATKTGGEIFEYLRVIDQIHKNKNRRRLSRPILIAAILYPILSKKVGDDPKMGEVIDATGNLIAECITSSFSHFPRRISAIAQSIICMQYRLDAIFRKRISKQKITLQRDFPASFKFLKIRSLIDNSLIAKYNAWSRAWRFYQKESPSFPTGRKR